MKSVSTYTATIYVGTREHDSGLIRSTDMAREWLHSHVDAGGLCVTLTETEFIYTKTKTVGGEPGFVVGLINYPRFPAESPAIRAKALYIAEELRKLYKQWKVSVVFPDETVMVETSLAGKHLAGSSKCPCSPCGQCMTPEEEKAFLGPAR